MHIFLKGTGLIVEPVDLMLFDPKIQGWGIIPWLVYQNHECPRKIRGTKTIKTTIQENLYENHGFAGTKSAGYHKA